MSLTDTPDDLLPPLDAASGPARHLSTARAASLIDGALAGFDALEPEAAVASPSPSPAAAPVARGSSSWRARRVVWALVACGMVLSAGAFAAGWRMRTRAESAATAAAHEASAQPARRAAASRAHLPRDPAIETQPAPVAAVVPSPVESAVIAPAPHRASAAPESADDLLRVANDLRAQHRWQDAARAYDRVRALHPGSGAAHVAAVASGALALEQLGRPASARRAYRAALAARPSGPLAEEARWGLASAERALGHRAAEAAALREFVRRFPTSLRRPSAEARLREID